MSDEMKPCDRCKRPTPVIRESGEPLVTVTTQRCDHCGCRAEHPEELHRDRPPTLAEIEAHEARIGCWWIFQRDGDDRPRRVLLLVRDGEVICDVDGAPSEIPTDAGAWWAWLDGPVAWPVP